MDRYITTCCPGCGRIGRGRSEHLGRSVACKHCGEQFRVSKHVHIDCPECRRDVRVPPALLGLSVVCKHCSATFQAKIAGDRPLVLPSTRPHARSLGSVSVVGDLEAESRRLETRLAASLVDRDVLLGERESLSLECNDLRARIVEFERHAQNLNESRSGLEQELARTREEREQAAREIAAFEIDRVSLHSAIASRQHSLEEVAARLAEADDRHSQTLADLENHARDSGDHRSRALELEKSLAEAIAHRESIATEIEALRTRLNESEDRHSQTLADLENHARDSGDHRSRALELEKSLAEAIAHRESIATEIEALRARLNESEDRHSQTLADSETLERELGELRARRPELEKTIAGLLDDREALSEENRRLRESSSTLERQAESLHAETVQALADRDEALRRYLELENEVARPEREIGELQIELDRANRDRDDSVKHFDELNDEFQRLTALALDLQSSRQAIDGAHRAEVDRLKSEYAKSQQLRREAERDAGEALGELLGLRAEVARQDQIIQFERVEHQRLVAALRRELEATRSGDRRSIPEPTEIEDELVELYREVALSRRIPSGRDDSRQTVSAPR